MLRKNKARWRMWALKICLQILRPSSLYWVKSSSPLSIGWTECPHLITSMWLNGVLWIQFLPGPLSISWGACPWNLATILRRSPGHMKRPHLRVPGDSPHDALRWQPAREWSAFRLSECLFVFQLRSQSVQTEGSCPYCALSKLLTHRNQVGW